MLADRMMRGEEGSELEARHEFLSEPVLVVVQAGRRLRGATRQGNRSASRGMLPCAWERADSVAQNYAAMNRAARPWGCPGPGLRVVPANGTRNGPKSGVVCPPFPSKRRSHQPVHARTGWFDEAF
jgi:hypothetical protein